MLFNLIKRIVSRKLLYLIVIIPTLIELIDSIEYFNRYVVWTANIILTGLLLLIVNKVLQFEKKLEESSLIDPLTKLYNRKCFDEQLDEQFELCKRTNGELVLLYIDLDNFKYINDHFGHTKGDEVLQEFSNILVNSTHRKMDFAFRVGGDEFTLLLVFADKGEADLFVKGLIRDLKQKSNDFLLHFKASISIGVAYSSESNSKRQLIEEADRLMYKDKRASKRLEKIIMQQLNLKEV